MLTALFERLFTQAPPAARELGLVKEHQEIAKRFTRVRAAWEPHLAASRAMILEVAAWAVSGEEERVSGEPQSVSGEREKVSSGREAGSSERGRVAAMKSGGRCVVIGAGDCLDVPVAELAGMFREVVLADVVVGTEARRLAKRFAGIVRTENWDASGALERLAEMKATVNAAGAARVFAESDPGPPPGGEADLLISANCISQLGLVPGHSLPAEARDKELPERCARAAGKRHVDWLRERAGVRLLLADAARLDLAPGGRQLKRETLHERFGLEKPERTWRWDLAPIPEWSRDFHRVHEVGAWVAGPGAPDFRSGI